MLAGRGEGHEGQGGHDPARPLAAALGLTGQRPDLVVRFGRGPTLPASLRRSVDSVMV
jgi:hypothetical protein